jgi:hypothetical protein
MGVSGPSEWTQQLQDPQHREEQETCFYLKYGLQKAEYLVSPIKIKSKLSHALSYATRAQIEFIISRNEITIDLITSYIS